MNQPIWQPTLTQIKNANITKFSKYIEEKHNKKFQDVHELYKWSIDNLEEFWRNVWDFCGVLAPYKGERVLIHKESMKAACFFPDTRLNFAQNLLKRGDEATAIFFNAEGRFKRTLSYKELRHEVACCAAALKDMGICPGDRIAALLPNIPEAVIFMLAATSIGAIWASCSPDFGIEGILDRFTQIDPRVLITSDGYYYRGKVFDILEKVKTLTKRLPTLERVIVTPYVHASPAIEGISHSTLYEAFKKGFESHPLTFQPLPFDHPLYILFSSGTTGAPKCILHSAGGTLIQHLKEHQLHCDIKKDDRVFYYTTCGWMMWHWCVSALASNAAIVLYDGSPTHPKEDILFDYADEVKMSFFGTSAKYIESIRKAGLAPIGTHDLSSLRMITSTGSPLVPESFTYVYQAIKKNVCLASISGGSDIISCFVLGSPILPVRPGEIQMRGLGMAVNVFDEGGHNLKGKKGELVCTKPFPSRPIGFWKDPTNEKYYETYYHKFDNVWCHGDFVQLTAHGGMIIYGRSDAVLNPGGVRIGTAEIYRQVNQLSEVVESLVVGQEWEDDIRVILFVKLKNDVSLTQKLAQHMKDTIKQKASPRHVPAKIIQVPDIPRTKNGKLVELSVRNIIHNRPVTNINALANPEALAYFKDLDELKN